MPAIGAKFEGKAKAPNFYKPAPKLAAPAKKEQHWPLLIGGALAGAAVLIYLRTRSSGSTGTAPVLSVASNPSADISQLQNMQGTVQAMLNNPNTGQTVATSGTPDSQTGITQPSIYTPPPSYQPVTPPTAPVTTAGTIPQGYGLPNAQEYTPGISPLQGGIIAVGPIMANSNTPGAGTGYAFAIPNSVDPQNVAALYKQDMSQAAAASGANYSPANYLAWLQKQNPNTYLGVNSGVPDPAEYQRNLAIAKANAGVK
jgi:hypothetical protein